MSTETTTPREIARRRSYYLANKERILAYRKANAERDKVRNAAYLEFAKRGLERTR